MTEPLPADAARTGRAVRGQRCDTIRGRNRVPLGAGLQGGSGSTVGPGRALYVSLEIIGRTVYVTLGGEIWEIKGVSR